MYFRVNKPCRYDIILYYIFVIRVFAMMTIKLVVVSRGFFYPSQYAGYQLYFINSCRPVQNVFHIILRCNNQMIYRYGGDAHSTTYSSTWWSAVAARRFDNYVTLPRLTDGVLNMNADIGTGPVGS